MSLYPIFMIDGSLNFRIRVTFSCSENYKPLICPFLHPNAINLILIIFDAFTFYNSSQFYKHIWVKRRMLKIKIS